ncbi:MAG: ArsR/SmtB family transcription factor [Pyrinomonadaceae bacterium]
MSSRKSHDLVFKALADTKRRKILDLLKDGPRTTGDLCASFKTLDRCTIMQHLGVLEKARLIFVKKEGKYRWNHIDVVPIREIYDRWINQYASPSVEMLVQLRKNVEMDSRT